MTGRPAGSAGAHADAEEIRHVLDHSAARGGNALGAWKYAAALAALDRLLAALADTREELAEYRDECGEQTRLRAAAEARADTLQAALADLLAAMEEFDPLPDKRAVWERARETVRLDAASAVRPPSQEDAAGSTAAEAGAATKRRGGDGG